MSEMYWHNFVTGESDYRTGPQTDEECRQYIPQSPAALNLYDLYQKMGRDPADAMLKVLEAVTGRNRGAS